MHTIKFLKNIAILLLVWSLPLMIQAQEKINPEDFNVTKPFSLWESLAEAANGAPQTTTGKKILVKDTIDYQRYFFQARASFSFLDLNAPATFYKAYFLDDVYFQSVATSDKVDFSWVKFEKKAIFKNSWFEEEVDFSRAKFGQLADFSKATFAKEVSFMHASLPDTLIFRNLNLIDYKGIINLTHATYKYEGNCLIDLIGTDLKKIMFDYTYFQLFFDWEAFPSNINETREMAIDKVYRKLLSNQKKYAFVRGYRKALKEYKVFKATLPTHNAAPNRIPRRVFDGQRSNTTNNLSIIGIVTLLIILLYLTIRRNNKAKVISVTPPIEKVKYEPPVVEEPLRYFQAPQVPLEQVQHTISQSEALWANYRLPENVLDDSEGFWQPYEKLLQKVKKQN